MATPPLSLRPLAVVAPEAAVPREPAIVAHPSCAGDLELYLRVGPEIARGTSGVVSPVLAAVDGGSYVVKEITYEPERDADVMREVSLHRLCSAGCHGIVRYVLATTLANRTDAAIGGMKRLVVLMEACRGELWKAVIASDMQNHVGVALGPSPPERSQSRPSSAVAFREVSLLEQAPPIEAAPSLSERWLWTRTLCKAVQYCRSLRVVHRDINPFNVLIATETEKGLRNIRLADFGLAVRIPEKQDELVGETSLDATPLDASALESLYSAPELGKRYGFAADVFSLGMTLFVIWYTAGLDGPNGADGFADDLVSALEVVKDSSKANVPVPTSFLDGMTRIGVQEKALRELIVRMVSSNPAGRPSLDEACKLCERQQSFVLDSRSPEAPPTPANGDDDRIGATLVNVGERVLDALRVLDGRGEGLVCSKALAHILQNLAGLDDVSDLEKVFRASRAINEDGRVDYATLVHWLFRT